MTAPCAQSPTRDYYYYKLGTVPKIVAITTAYPPATVSGSLQNCTLQNGWCVTSPQLQITTNEPVSDKQILLIEGTRNGETFACQDMTCSLPLLEGGNRFEYWALSSWGDSSEKGVKNIQVDTIAPSISGEVSGQAGENGWYVSPVEVSVVAFDPTPGSGIERLEYALDDDARTAYSASLLIEEGIHTLFFQTQDRAGHVVSGSQNIQVDTIAPQANISLQGQQANGWYLSQVALLIEASDNGSGLARVEYALDGDVWQPYNDVVTIGDGVHQLRVRAFDVAGNSVETHPLSFQVDATPPYIELPASWAIWESGKTLVRDEQSGLVSVEIEIRDPQGRWKKISRAYESDGRLFSTDIVWDRRFADGVLAPTGNYLAAVTAVDRAGNASRETAYIMIPAPGVTPTALPTRTAAPTIATTPIMAQTVLASPTAVSAKVPAITSFGVSLATQTQLTNSNGSSNVLWGAAAMAAIGAATAYALEEQKKRKEEEARSLRQAQAETARLIAAEEQRKAQQWLEEQAILRAQQEAARQQQAKHNQTYRVGERVSMSTRNDPRIPLFFSSHFRREFSEDLPNGITIPPLSSTQNSNLKNWNVAAQVAIYGVTAGIGALVGAGIGTLIPGGTTIGGTVGAITGVMWGAYEANCIASVQEEFDKAYSQSGSVQVWREGWKFNVYGGRDSYTVANGPLSASYVAVTTYLLTGKVP